MSAQHYVACFCIAFITAGRARSHERGAAESKLQHHNLGYADDAALSFSLAAGLQRLINTAATWC